MCKLFDEWAPEIEKYCLSNGLDYQKAKNMSKSWGKYEMALQYFDKEMGKMGLLDETPAPVVLRIRKLMNGSLEFEQTEYTKQYLS